MVELRWLELQETDTSRVLIGNGPFPRKRVLQYRQMEQFPSGMIGEPVSRWSDWRDVPTVSETE